MSPKTLLPQAQAQATPAAITNIAINTVVVMIAAMLHTSKCILHMREFGATQLSCDSLTAVLLPSTCAGT
jgi:hypothetical protein